MIPLGFTDLENWLSLQAAGGVILRPPKSYALRLHNSAFLFNGLVSLHTPERGFDLQLKSTLGYLLETIYL